VKRHWRREGEFYRLIDSHGWIRAIIYFEIEWQGLGPLGTGKVQQYNDTQKRRLMRSMEAMLTKWERL